MRNIDEDTAAHDLVIDQWQDVGTACRVIHSHRRPRSARRGPLALIALATVVSLGITGTAVATQPESVQVTASVFVQPTDDDILQRMISEANPRVTRAERDPKPKTKPAATPKPKPRWVSPTKKVVATSCYGTRWGRMHNGVDFDGETGDKIRSVNVGTVVQAGWRYSGLGYSVVIRHPGGWMTLYGHMSKVTARPGQTVSAGDLVGLMGSTGHSTGSHLHFGVAKTSSTSDLFNSFVNPASWLESHGVSAGKCS